MISSDESGKASLTITDGSDPSSRGTFTVDGFTNSTVSVFSIEQNGSVTLENIDFVTNGSALYPNGKASSVLVDSCTVTAGVYCVGTNNKVSGENDVSITLRDSVLTGKDSTYGNGYDNCSVMINLENAVMEIDGCTINGDRQCVFVRCGTATITDTEINFSNKASSQNDITARYPQSSTSWSSGDEAACAAVVVGDYDCNTSYAGTAKLTISGGSINAEAGYAMFVCNDDNTNCNLTVGKDSATTITIGSNSMAVTNLKATSEMSIKEGSIVISGTLDVGQDVTITASGKVKLADGTTLEGTGDLTIETQGTGSDVVISNLNIPSGITLNIDGAVTVTGDLEIEGSVSVGSTGSMSVGSGATVSGTVTNNGTVTVDPNATTNGMEFSEDSNGNAVVSGDGDIQLGENGTKALQPGFKYEDIVITIGSDDDETNAITGTFSVNQALNIYVSNRTLHIGGEPSEATTTGAGETVITGSMSILVPAQIDSDIIYPAGSNLEIEGDVTIAAGVSVSMLGKITGSGSIILSSGSLLYYSELPSTISIENNGGTVKKYNNLGLTNVLDQDLDVQSGMYLTQDLEVPYGYTITVYKGGILDLNGYTITVYGDIIVMNGGIITSNVESTSGNQMVLVEKGTISNEGTIGIAQPIDVVNGNNADQKVTIQKVKGVAIEMVKSGQTYNMKISGNVTKVSGQTGCALSAYDVEIGKDLTVGDSVTLNVTGVTVAKNVTVTVSSNGALNITDALTLSNGSVLDANGKVSGKVQTTAGEIKSGDDFYTNDTGNASPNNVAYGTPYFSFDGQEVGFEVSVGRVTLTNADGDAYTVQRLYITGTIDKIKNAEDPMVTVSGTVFVKDKLVIENVTVGPAEGGTATFDVSVSGTVQKNKDGTFEASYIGAKYSVESEDKTYETVYYASFDSAYAAVSGTEDAVIEISGTYTISGNYEIGNGMAVDIVDGGSASITVAESARVDVAAEGTFDGNAFEKIEGIVYVVEGIGCEPREGSYAVSSEDDDGNMTYSGFKVALDNAVSGNVIEVVGDATYRGSLTVTDGVTVNVNGVELRITGNLTIPENSKLVLKGDAELIAGTADKESTISVYGLLDATDGTVTNETDASVNLYSTGTTEAGVNGVNIGSASSINESPDVGGTLTINAAYYDDGERVYTSVAKAIAYCENNSGYPISITVTGIVTEKDAITSNDIDIVIANGAKVTLGDVTLVKASIYSAASEEEADQGVYTANVSGLTGTGDVAVLSTVSVTETTAKIENKVTVNAQGADVCETTIDKVAGKSTAVTAGKIVFVGTSIATSDSVTAPVKLSVSSGAELVIYNATDGVDIDAEIDNEGTVTLKGEVYFDAKIGGNVIIADEADVTSELLWITGTLTVSDTEDKEGALSVVMLIVGDVPTSLGSAGTVVGKVTLVDTETPEPTARNGPANDGTTIYGAAFIFDGSSVSDAEFIYENEPAKSTSYTINGIPYATVYGGVDIYAINFFVAMMEDLVTFEDDAALDDVEWYSGETLVEMGTTVGTYAAVSAEIDYALVDVKVSVMPRITLSIDGVVYAATEDNLKSLSIGTHTVSVTPYPGYSGDITVTFDGKTVTDGKIVITADMIGEKAPLLSVTGNIVVDSGTVTSSGVDGLGLTDYLLIILVVLIAIMAIIVALRLTRS